MILLRKKIIKNLKPKQLRMNENDFTKKENQQLRMNEIDLLRKKIIIK